MRYVENRKRIKEETVDVKGDMSNLIFGLTNFFGSNGLEKYGQIDWELNDTFDILSLDKRVNILMLVKGGKTIVGIPVGVINKLDYSGRTCIIRIDTNTNRDVIVSIKK